MPNAWDGVVFETAMICQNLVSCRETIFIFGDYYRTENFYVFFIHPLFGD